MFGAHYLINLYIYIPGNLEERELSKYCTSVYVSVYVCVYIDAHRCIYMCVYMLIAYKYV